MSNLQTVQDIYAAFGRGDIPAILDELADDVRWDHLPELREDQYFFLLRGDDLGKLAKSGQLAAVRFLSVNGCRQATIRPNDKPQ